MTVRIEIVGFLDVPDEMFDFAAGKLTARGESEVESARVCDLKDVDFCAEGPTQPQMVEVAE